jgi:hypothetical protein
VCGVSLTVVLFCVICVFCLIVVPLPPGKNPFTVIINNNNKNWETQYAVGISEIATQGSRDLMGQKLGLMDLI